MSDHRDLKAQLRQCLEARGSVSGPTVVHLGAEYFAELSEQDALEFLSKKISHLQSALAESGPSAPSQDPVRDDGVLSDIVEHVDANGPVGSHNSVNADKSGLPVMDIVEHLDDDDNVVRATINNEGVAPRSVPAAQPSPLALVDQLAEISDVKNADSSADFPVMDIVERLDDDGNVVSATVNNKDVGGLPTAKKSEKPVQNQASPVMDIIEHLDDDDNITRVTINDQEVAPPKVKPQRPSQSGVLHDIVEHLDDNDNVISATVNHKPAAAGKPATAGADEPEEVKELLSDMGLQVTQAPNVDVDDVLEKLDSLELDPDAKFQIKQKFLENMAQESSLDKARQEAIADIIKENNLQLNSDVSIDTSDLIELELIADDFQDENFEGGEDEWDFDFDEDDEDDSYADELLYGGEKFFQGEGNPANALLFDQINKMRTEKLEEQPSSESKSKSRTKKSVKFAEKLDIFEIEKITKDDYVTPAPRVSRFKQEKQFLRKTPNSDNADDVPKPDDSAEVMSDVIENHVSGESPAANTEPSPGRADNSNDLLDMMVKYNSELDDIEGPVIENLKDIERLNKTIETMNIDDYELEHAHDHSHSDSDGVLADVSENEVRVDEELSEIMDYDNLNQQIKLDYVRLKEKVNRVAEAQENEIEITNKPRVSRFKQNMVQNRK